MRIGFDVSQTAENKAGCGFLADQLIRYLLKHDRDNEYLLYPTFYSYRHHNYKKATSVDVPNCNVSFRNLSFREMVNEWDTTADDRTQWLGHPDIIHSNNFSCKKDHSARIVYTLYDVAPLVYPQFTTEENRIVCFNGLFEASLYADHCIAISEYTKASFLHFFPHYPEDRITIIPLGVRENIVAITDRDIIKKRLERFNLPEEFWLGVGTLEPRKNYSLLIDSYMEIKDNRPLVIAGGKGWLESDIINKLNKFDNKEKVKFLGYVSDDELSALYSTCFAFVYPSYYEGFGLPILEAMHCGATVITSKTSSLPEVGGDAVLYIDPDSKESLIEKMYMLITNSKIKDLLKSKARERAAMFSWDDAAKITIDVYGKVIENRAWMEDK